LASSRLAMAGVATRPAATIRLTAISFMEVLPHRDLNDYEVTKNFEPAV
jgi:hypothetical protein